jgi:endoglucanase Acf2
MLSNSARSRGCFRRRQTPLLTLLVVAVSVAVPLQSTARPAGRAQHAGVPVHPYNQVPGPVPTHRFWAAKNWFPLNLTPGGGEYTMFAEPLALQTTATGLQVGYSHDTVVQENYFFHPAGNDLTLGVADLHVNVVPVVAYSDWTVDFEFGPLTTRVGRGMPFVYAQTKGEDPTVTFTTKPTVFRDEGHLLGVTVGNNHYGLFCPTGGTWTTSDKVLRCHLPAGRHYLSLALLPSREAFDQYAKAAFVFPIDTRVHWSYDPHTSAVQTTCHVTTEVREGAGDAEFFQALYPHQYASMAPSEIDTPYSYVSARGSMKVIRSADFTTHDTFHGILPYLPLTGEADLARQRELLRPLRNEAAPFAAADTYGKGKALNRMAQLLPLTEMSGDGALQQHFATDLRHELDRWSAPGERSSSVFKYDRAWGTLLGYPDSFGSVQQLNDHHFHYGYWIHAAALLAMYDPGWEHDTAAQHMIDDLVGDIATIHRDDALFPMLRNFDAYAGHSWASGQAPFRDGENQESSSEAINAWAGLILYAEGKNDTELRDAAIWMYTLETNAAFTYWFNAGPVKTFPDSFHRTQISNLFDGKSDTATWFGNAPEFKHGIQFLPFTGASLYLGRDAAYVRKNLAEVQQQSATGLNGKGDRWPDLMALYQSLADPDAAMKLWERTTFTFDGETRAHEFAWMRAMNALGTVDQTVTADTPLFAVFIKNGRRTHLAFNMGRSPRRVVFSDGAVLQVKPRTMGSDAASPQN